MKWKHTEECGLLGCNAAHQQTSVCHLLLAWLALWACRWKWYVSPKCWAFSELHRTMTHKIHTFHSHHCENFKSKNTAAAQEQFQAQRKHDCLLSYWPQLQQISVQALVGKEFLTLNAGSSANQNSLNSAKIINWMYTYIFTKYDISLHVWVSNFKIRVPPQSISAPHYIFPLSEYLVTVQCCAHCRIRNYDTEAMFGYCMYL